MTVDPETVGTIDSEPARVERLVNDIATVSLAQERQLDLNLRPNAANDLRLRALCRPSSQIRTGCRRCWPTSSTTPCGTRQPEAR